MFNTVSVVFTFGILIRSNIQMYIQMSQTFK